MKKTKIKIAVFAIHRPLRSPNERYRWHQYEKFLLQNNISADYYYIVNAHDDHILFHSKNFIAKIFIYIKTFFKRWQQIQHLSSYDAIFIYRELHWFGLFTQTLLKKIRKKTPLIIFDFDDAVWINSRNPLINLIKKPRKKTIAFIQHADKVIAGNAYLAAFAQQYNPHTQIIPTVVDTDYFKPLPDYKHPHSSVTIGWMGSHSTLNHLKTIIPVLKKIKTQYPQVTFRFVGKKEYIPELDTYVEDWNKEKEVEILNSFDIGIMPLPDDEWSKGKCGLKLLTYLACEVPAIASNVGVNKEIIEKSNGGYCCSNENEWTEKLSLLIENSSLRTQLGQQGRKNIEKYYSLNAWKEVFLNTIISNISHLSTPSTIKIK
ncbi:MAG: hypothetical protein Fur0023_09410 [Bacteroidia bacterium]